MKIRIAKEEDLPAIVDIFNQAIRSRNSCGFTDEVDLAERKAWFADHDALKHPVYTAELDGRIAGFGSMSPYRPGREAMNKVAEVSFFLDFSCHRQGIGSALLKFMIRDCHRLGFKSLIAILLGTNEASIRLLEKHGFKEWGRMPDVIDFGDRKCDHLYYGLSLP